MRVETLTPNFSIKDGKKLFFCLKIVSKTKMKNCWSLVDQGLRCHKLYSQFKIPKNFV